MKRHTVLGEQVIIVGAVRSGGTRLGCQVEVFGVVAWPFYRSPHERAPLTDQHLHGLMQKG